MPDQIRLNKYIANSGLFSRRGADDVIKEGKVTVNGKTVTEPGTIVAENSKVEINGEKIKSREKKYVIFYKPAGYITTKSDPQNRRTIYCLLPTEIHHLKPAGRLDKDSSGLILLTNDGELIQKLTHPKVKVPKVYRVIVEGRVTNRDILTLGKGIEIEEGKIAYANAAMTDCSQGKSTLEVTLYQGYNRQIRRMMDKIGHPVIALKRISHASLTLAGLEKGKYRYLSSKEVRDLMNYINKIK